MRPLGLAGQCSLQARRALVWHVDLAHYVHKGGSDINLANHRPLVLIEVFRKVFTSVIIGRMRGDWNRSQVLDSCNPGFQAGRTTYHGERNLSCSNGSEALRAVET